MRKDDFFKRIRVKLEQNEKTVQRDELIEGGKSYFYREKGDNAPHRY